MSVDVGHRAAVKDSSPTSPARRTLRLQNELDKALRTGASVALDGPGVGDLLVTHAGQARRVLLFLAGWAADHDMANLIYSLDPGVRSIASPGCQPLRTPTMDADTPPAVVLRRLIDQIRGLTHPALLVIDFAEHLVPENTQTPHTFDVAMLIQQIASLAVDRAWVDAGNQLILIGRTGPVDTRLTRQPGFVITTFELPDLPERELFIDGMLQSEQRQLHLAEDLDHDRVARLSGGLLLDDLDRLRRNSHPQNPVTTAQIVGLKVAALRRLAGPTLEIIPEQLSFDDDVAGLPQLRLLLRDAKATATTSLRVILAGPPGTGKTRAFTALAAELGVPAVRFGQIPAPYLGQAEENMDRALTAITAMAPVAVLIDECESAGLGHRSARATDSASEANAHLRAKLFGFLGDTGNQAGITIVGATNFPERLDPAALSRFQLLPVLHPSHSEAAQIMDIQAKRQDLTLDLSEAEAALAEHNMMLTGRQAVGLVDRAAVYAAYEQSRHLTGRHIRNGLADLGQRDNPAEEYQALQALAHTTWKSHRPWVAAKKLGLAVQLPPYVAPLLDEYQDLDAAKLQARIVELGRVGANR